MARWQVTIRQPASATPAIPELVLDTFGEDGYSRSQIQQVNLRDFTVGGSAIISGATYPYRYTWAIACQVSEDDALQLEALVVWQDKQYAAGLDGRLRLIDEVEFLPPEAAPHSKTLIAPETNSYGFLRGFGSFDVKISLPDSHKTHVGRSAEDGLPVKLLQFSAVELP